MTVMVTSQQRGALLDVVVPQKGVAKDRVTRRADHLTYEARSHALSRLVESCSFEMPACVWIAKKSTTPSSVPSAHRRCTRRLPDGSSRRSGARDLERSRHPRARRFIVR